MSRARKIVKAIKAYEDGGDAFYVSIEEGGYKVGCGDGYHRSQLDETPTVKAEGILESMHWFNAELKRRNEEWYAAHPEDRPKPEPEEDR